MIDYRIHVCFGEGMAYYYKTMEAIQVIRDGDYRLVDGYESGVNYATSKGYLVPPADIGGCKHVQIPGEWLRNLNCQENDSPEDKGSKAVRVAHGLIREGKLFLTPVRCQVTSKQEDLDGTDLRVYSRVQVKCDWPGGVGGTGYLFIQVAECNPLKRH